MGTCVQPLLLDKVCSSLYWMSQGDFPEKFRHIARIRGQGNKRFGRVFHVEIQAYPAVLFR